MRGRGRAYSFAQSAAALSQYIAYVQHAAAIYHPQKVVVAVNGTDFDQSVYRHRPRDGLYQLYPRSDGGFDLKLTPLPEPGVIERILRHSALALYLARNVGISRLLDQFRIGKAQAAQAADDYVGNTPAAADAARVKEGEAVIAWFLATLPHAAMLAPRDILIVVDAMRPAIYDEAAFKNAQQSYFGQMRTKLISDAHSQGFQVIDLDETFRAAYALDHTPFEFPTDGHWNAHGHEVVASAIQAVLAGWVPFGP